MQIDAYDTSINSVATVDEDDDGKPSEKLKVSARVVAQRIRIANWASVLYTTMVTTFNRRGTSSCAAQVNVQLRRLLLQF